jgi:hypothetical protein
MRRFTHLLALLASMFAFVWLMGPAPCAAGDDIPPSEFVYNGVIGDPDIPESHTRGGDAGDDDEEGDGGSALAATDLPALLSLDDADIGDDPWWELVQWWLTALAIEVPVR